MMHLCVLIIYESACMRHEVVWEIEKWRRECSNEVETRASSLVQWIVLFQNHSAASFNISSTFLTTTITIMTTATRAKNKNESVAITKTTTISSLQQQFHILSAHQQQEQWYFLTENLGAEREDKLNLCTALD